MLRTNMILVLLMTVMVLGGCVQQEEQEPKSEQPLQMQRGIEYIEYASPGSSSMETFTMSYPGWEKTESNDTFAVVSMKRGDSVCSFQLNAVEAPVKWYEAAVKEYFLKNNGKLLSKNPPSYQITTDDNYTFVIKTKGMLCDDRSYHVFFSCLDGRYDDATAQNVFDSMHCERNWTVPKRSNKKLGMTINPENTSVTYSGLTKAYNLARNSGIQVTHHYVVWGETEIEQGNYNWTSQDYTMNLFENKGLELSLVFNVIHTSVVGTLPEDIAFTSFDDPEFVQRFTTFALDYIKRYEGTIDYVEIGNEVNIYLYAHPDELESYASFYRQVYDAIKKEYPELPVGTVFAYHEMKRKNTYDIYEALNTGDFDAFTLYIYSEGFVFDRDPSKIRTYLLEIENLTGDRKFAMEEVGWNTFPGLRGSEEDQEKAVGYFFDYLEDAPDRLEFMSWFILHDGSKKECIRQGKSFFMPDDPVIENVEVMDVFSDFLCYLGMISADGTQKQAWSRWVSRAKEYNEKAHND